MISNSSPLICLSKVGRLALLKELYGEVHIPTAVRDEVLVDGKEDCVAIKKALQEGWLKVVEPKTFRDYGIGPGENQALQLAFEKKDTIVLDDARAIRIARIMGVRHIRTTSVILQAVTSRKLSRDEAVDVLNNMIGIGYYIAPKYYSRLLTRLLQL